MEPSPVRLPLLRKFGFESLCLGVFLRCVFDTKQSKQAYISPYAIFLHNDCQTNIGRP